MSKIGNEPKSSIRQKIPTYITKIEKEQESYESQFSRIAEQFLHQTSQQIALSIAKSKQSFQKYRKKLTKELTTLHYYSEHPEENHNLYPLFNQIDQKWNFNINLIQQTHLRISLPFPDSCHLDQEVFERKLAICENYIGQLQDTLKSEAIKKYCKKEFQNAEKVNKTYIGLLQNVKETVYSSEVKIKRVFEQAIAELPKYRHVQKLVLSIITIKGILMPAHYQQLVDSLRPNRAFLCELDLKIMDMQFSQEKCDVLRKRLSGQFKFLKRFSIQNYYKECKLGFFQDFNWQPYRKKVNVNAGVW